MRKLVFTTIATVALACTTGAASAQAPFTTYDTRGGIIGSSPGGKTGTLINYGKSERFVRNRDGSTTFTKEDGSRYTLRARIVSKGGPPYITKIYLRDKHISTVKTHSDGSMETYDPRGNLVATGR
jgi:hypothetical protein